jgi:hypothetical protein
MQFVSLVAGAAAVGLAMLTAQPQTQPAPFISNARIVGKDVAKHDRIEIHFDADTVASNLSLPFDAAPPPGMPAGIGVSVDGLFSPDNWTTVITQPAFLYQPYQRSMRAGNNHLIPDGPPRWVVRFAPQQSGAWQVRLRAQDAGGTTLYPAPGQRALTFNVAGQSANANRRRGFLRVSQSDPRYFEFQDGTPFIGVGYNDAFRAVDKVEQKMALQARYKINFLRAWMSAHGINGSQWTSWAYPNQPSDYVPLPSLDITTTFQDADVSLRLDDAVRCLWTDFWQDPVPVLPNTTYEVSARVRLANLAGPRSPGPWGFAMKLGGWLGEGCDRPGQGTLITAPETDTTGWITVTGRLITRSDQSFLDNLFLTRQNATAGQAYIDEVQLVRVGDPDRVNILREPNANSHMHFDGMNAALWDAYIEAAEKNGIYLKLVIDEKNEWIRNHIGADGRMTSEGSNDNFYAAPSTKVRWLHQAWWRYLIARWGYSTAIHSFEFVNEGDPYNGHHHEAADAMARYFDAHDPSQHMVTTSLWHSFPNRELWSNPHYSAIDYADLHAYISTGWGADASFLRPELIETRPEYTRDGKGSAHLTPAFNERISITPRGVVRGPGEWILRYWMKANAFTTDCGYGSTGGMQRVRWLVDGGDYSGGEDNIVPANQERKDFICASPADTFDWTQFRSDRDREGRSLPVEHRLVLTDTQPHEIEILVENFDNTGGEAWIDSVELVSPLGEVVPVIGTFDPTPFLEDPAWFNRAYGDLFGGRSPVGARKPIVRGETGLDSPERQDWDRELNKDERGIWLHNFIWGQVNPGGMYDLLWWASDTIDQNIEEGRYTHIYTHFLTYQNFMAGIPLNNGHYRDARAETSSPELRAWGQRDDTAGRMHLWIQNTQHTWRRAANSQAVPPIRGQITLPDVRSGVYRVTWWDTYAEDQPVFLEQTVNHAGGNLVLALPRPLADDFAVKVERMR